MHLAGDLVERSGRPAAVAVRWQVDRNAPHGAIEASDDRAPAAAVERQPGVVESQAPDGFRPDGDEIGGGVVALWQAIDLVIEVLERGLGDRGDEALLGPEQAVDGPRGGTRLGGCGPHRQRVGTALCDDRLGRRP